MSTAEKIMQVIESHPVEELFSRQALVKYGPARAVDSAIKRLIDKGIIIREIRGLYYKNGRTRTTTVEEVARVKAESFGRKFFSDAVELAKQFGIVRRLQIASGRTFATDARTSSFDFHGLRITLKGTSPKKVALGDSPPGKIIRALCAVGKGAITQEIVTKVTTGLSFKQMTEIAARGHLMPAWLSEFFYAWNLIDKEEAMKNRGYKPFPNDRTVNESTAQYDYFEYSQKNERPRWYQHEVLLN